VSRDLESTSAVARVGRLDGRSRIVGVSSGAGTGWRRPARREAFTGDAVIRLRSEGVRVVELRRGLRRARMPLAWLPEHSLVP
jgi:hypothetical protein